MVLRALQLQERIKKGDKSIPFQHLTFCNIGNPQELGQKPITFFRQVSALINYPQLLDTPAAAAAFPPDALDRARSYLKTIPGGIGAYTHSQGEREEK